MIKHELHLRSIPRWFSRTRRSRNIGLNRMGAGLQREPERATRLRHVEWRTQS